MTDRPGTQSVLFLCTHNAGRSQMAMGFFKHLAGDACPYLPGKRYENWELADPADLGVDEVRPIRDVIESRVRHFIDQLGVKPQPPE